MLPWTDNGFESVSRNHVRVSANVCQDKRFCTIVSAQSRDHASVLCNLKIVQVYCISVLCNLEIAQVYCATLRSRKCIVQPRDRASVLCNLEIAQVCCAISRSRNYSAQSRDSENAQRNQIARNIYKLTIAYLATHAKCYLQIVS